MMMKFLQRFGFVLRNSVKGLFEIQYMPNGRWLLEKEYNGTMSSRAHKNSVFNNHDHCGGELCKYPPHTR